MNVIINSRKDELTTKRVVGLFILTLLVPLQANATSGACSWHLGVNCDAGADWDGSVICNDGWRDSGVAYNLSCDNNEDSCPRYLDSNSYNSLLNEINNAIEKIRTETEATCQYMLQNATDRTNQLYQSCASYNGSLRTIASRSGNEPNNLRDCESEKNANDISDNNDYQLCLFGDDYMILQYEGLKACMVIDTFDYCTLEIPNSKTVGGYCQCKDGYSYNRGYTRCTKDVTCVDLTNGYLSDGRCYCYSGYQMDQKGICKKYEPEEVIGAKEKIEQDFTEESNRSTEADLETDQKQIAEIASVVTEEAVFEQSPLSAPILQVDNQSGDAIAVQQQIETNSGSEEKDLTGAEPAAPISEESPVVNKPQEGQNWFRKVFGVVSNWLRQLKFW